MGTNILPTYHDSSSITASSLTDWLSLGDLENLDAPYTETGYLEFPMALVKQYGPASRTLAAFASLESVQRYNVTQQRLEDVRRMESSMIVFKYQTTKRSWSNSVRSWCKPVCCKRRTLPASNTGKMHVTREPGPYHCLTRSTLRASASHLSSANTAPVISS